MVRIILESLITYKSGVKRVFRKDLLDRFQLNVSKVLRPLTALVPRILLGNDDARPIFTTTRLCARLPSFASSFFMTKLRRKLIYKLSEQLFAYYRALAGSICLDKRVRGAGLQFLILSQDQPL